jgi:hypothetical protein
LREEEELFSDLPQPRLFHKFREGEVTFLLGLLDREMGCWSRSECVLRAEAAPAVGIVEAEERERGREAATCNASFDALLVLREDCWICRKSGEGALHATRGDHPGFVVENGRRPSFLFFPRSCLSWPVQVRSVLPSPHNDDDSSLLQRERRERERTSLATASSTKAYSRCRPAFLCPGPSSSYGKPRSSYKVVVRRQNSCSDELPL